MLRITLTETKRGRRSAKTKQFINPLSKSDIDRQTLASLLYYLTRQSTVSNRAITLFYQQGFPKPCIALARHVKGKVFDAKENKTKGQLNFQTELLTQRQVEQSIITSETPDSMHRHHMTL